ncbi:MAG: hypothetical protein HYZ53_10635 [Planctomycetes bacterium]|nr:hypothetical protein [Planctomycetota bacterium]
MTESPPETPPQAPVAARRFRRAALAAGLAAGMLLLAGVALRGNRLPVLTPEALAHARRAWDANGPSSYRLTLTTEGTGLSKGVFVVSVRDGVVASTTRDGVPTTGEAVAYTVPGLFTILAEEVELAKDPQRSYHAPEGYAAYLSAAFHPSYGYPLRFRRVVGGANTSSELIVTGFEPGAEDRRPK